MHLVKRDRAAHTIISFLENSTGVNSISRIVHNFRYACAFRSSYTRARMVVYVLSIN